MSEPISVKDYDEAINETIKKLEVALEMTKKLKTIRNNIFKDTKKLESIYFGLKSSNGDIDIYTNGVKKELERCSKIYYGHSQSIANESVDNTIHEIDTLLDAKIQDVKKKVS